MNARVLFYFSLTCLFFLFYGCSENGLLAGFDNKRLTVMTYNTQTFFDAIEDGSEFSEFVGGKTKWSKDLYETRLDRLREALLVCGRESGMGPDRGPDIVVLQEIENERVLRDLCNRMPQRCSYDNAVFVPPDKGNAFGTALLSRFPVESVTAHSVSSSDLPLRPLLEIQIQVGNGSFVVFAVHWKSKSGDGDTSSLRLAQEILLSERIRLLQEKTPHVPFIACGDFNQKQEDFSVLTSLYNCWDTLRDTGETSAVKGPSGSYYYQGNWETIDNMFYSDCIREGTALGFAGFQVIAVPPLVTSEATPARFELYNGRGYSDHLPLVLELKINNP